MWSKSDKIFKKKILHSLKLDDKYPAYKKVNYLTWNIWFSFQNFIPPIVQKLCVKLTLYYKFCTWYWLFITWVISQSASNLNLSISQPSIIFRKNRIAMFIRYLYCSKAKKNARNDVFVQYERSGSLTKKILYCHFNWLKSFFFVNKKKAIMADSNFCI